VTKSPSRKKPLPSARRLSADDASAVPAELEEEAWCDNWHEKGENDSWKTAHGRRERVVMELIAVLRSINDPTSEFAKIASHLHDHNDKLKRSTMKKKLRRTVSQTVAAATAVAFAQKTLARMIFEIDSFLCPPYDLEMSRST
jgi:predicted RNA-binding Zn ribbon-like protein